MSSKETFEPIPSLNYQYEIDTRGVVRNAKTKRVKKARYFPYHTNLVSVYVNGKGTTRCITSLLHEVHGILPERNVYQPVSVIIRKGYETYAFESLGKAAKFLAKKIFYCATTIKSLFIKRPEEIGGWKIFYREPEKRKPISGAKANGDCELRRGAKNHETLRHLRE